MTKIALITDQHAGIRNDSEVFLNYQQKFYDDIFFPYVDKENIKVIFDGGDCFDRRKYVNFKTLSRFKKMWFDQIENRNLKLYSIAGNHNVYHKNTNDINSLSLLLKEYSTVTYFETEPQELDIYGTKFLFVPWITATNQEICLEKIRTSNASILLGHLEVQGFEMYKGSISEHGFNMSEFNRFEYVLSGHFHYKSNYGNIHYLGAPYQMTWSDYGCPKGFHVFDTETRELTFIKNPYEIFHKVKYSDKNWTMETISEMDFALLENCYVKVEVLEKTNPYLFDMFIDKIQKSSCVEVKIIENVVDSSMISSEDINEIEDTITILEKYVNSMDMDYDKKRVEDFVRKLYMEATEYVSI